MLNSGDVLQSRYRLVRMIDSGGMGTVYLAEDTRLPGRRCAIKEMSPIPLALHERNWAIQSFRQEAQMLAQLQHPGLTAVTDFFPERGCWYLVMDYVDGVTLAQQLAKAGGRLPLDQAIDITRQLCKVLAYLHAQSPPVIFRDLKPGNIMLTSQGQVKLIDFGIARFFKPGKTQDTRLLGTPGYAAPEQYGGFGQSDPRTDVYSLGVALMQMVTGYDPTQSNSPVILPDVESLGCRLPPRVVKVIKRAIQTEPESRYPDIMALCRALDVPEVETDVTGAKQTRLWWMGGGTLAVVIMVLVWALQGGNPPDGEPSKTVPVASVTPTEGPPVTQTPTIDIEPTATLRPTRTSPPAPTPTFAFETTVTPQGEALIAFVRVDRDTDRDGHVNFNDRRLIYVMTVGGRNLRKLHDDASFETYHSPSWSPEGTALIFAAKRDGIWRLYLIDVDGSDLRTFNLPVTNNRGPAWSPDGRYIAFYSGPEKDEDIYVLDLQRNIVNRLTDTSGSDKYPAWSPASDQLVFYSERDGNQEIYRMNRDGSRQDRLTRHSGADYWPVWSPDGKSVAFASERYGHCQEICLLDLGSGRVRRLTYSQRHATSPSWSPGGDSLIFVRWEDDGYDHCGLYRINVDSGNETALISQAGLHTRPAVWMP